MRIGDRPRTPLRISRDRRRTTEAAARFVSLGTVRSRAPPLPGARSRAGRRVPPLRPPARARARAQRVRPQRRRRRRDRGRGPADRARRVRGGARRRRAPGSPACDRSPPSRSRRCGEAAFAIRRERSAARRRGCVDPAGRRDLRRLPARALRPGRPPLPLPVPQLHAVRPALHDRRAPFRTTARARRWPASRSAPTAGASTRTRPTAASTPSRSRARSAGRSCRCPSRRRSRSCARGGIVAVKGLGGYHLACDAGDEDAGRTAARAQAPRGEAARGDDRRPGCALPSSTTRSARCSLARAADRARCAGARAQPVAGSVAPGSPGSASCSRTRRSTTCSGTTSGGRSC